MAIVLDGSVGISNIGTLTGVTSISSAAADTPVILQDSSSNSNTCRAWVNFDGTGTIAIRNDFNVTSLTDNGTGDYTVTFTNAMPDANYAVTGSSIGSSAFTMVTSRGSAPNASTTAVRFVTRDFVTTYVDCVNICIAVFR